MHGFKRAAFTVPVLPTGKRTRLCLRYCIAQDKAVALVYFYVLILQSIGTWTVLVLINELVASDSGSWQIYRIPPQNKLKFLHHLVKTVDN